MENPKSFNWRQALEHDTRKGWTREVNANPKNNYASRIGVLVQLKRPCHNGNFKLHASVLWAEKDKFVKLFGWTGFDAPPESGRPLVRVPPSATSPSPALANRLAPALGAASTPVRAPLLSTGPAGAVPSPEAQWQEFVGKLSCVNGWVHLADFLKREEIGEKSGHGKRFLDGTHKKKQWRSDTGHLAVQSRDWEYKKTSAGGGAGQGNLYCNKTFVKHVFKTHYVKKRTR